MLQKSTVKAFSCKSRQAAPADDVVRRHADFLQCSNRSVFLRGFARCLLPATRAHGCCCSQPLASRCAWLFLPHGFPKFGFLSCAGNLLRLVLGNGIWVGGIEIEALDDLRFEKSYVLKSLNPKP